MKRNELKWILVTVGFWFLNFMFGLIVLPAHAAPNLPEPNPKHRSYSFSEVTGWSAGQTPKAPEGFKVSRLADGFRNPRSIYVGPNGDIFVAEAETENRSVASKFGAKVTGSDKSQNMNSSANRVTLLRLDKNGTVATRTTFINDLKQPFGMLILGNYFYVANTDGLWRYPYKVGQTEITERGQKILGLPAGGYNNHWTRNIVANPAGTKIYVSVGSGSNVAEHGMENEIRRANILEINPDGTGERVYASGLRNPVPMDWQPGTNILWTAVNERDDLGDDLVPDYLTSVKEGGFYGWPYSYWGAHEDPRLKEKKPELVKSAIVPDVDLGAHTAALGFLFYKASAFPPEYQNGAFVSLHGSWNRSTLVGYKVVFVPFKNGKATGTPKDFLTDFISNLKEREVHGRPVGLALTKEGALLVADDASNVIWKVSR